MSDIVTERSGSVLRVQLNRPASKNAMTSAMYISLADLFNTAAQDDQIRVDSARAGDVLRRQHIGDFVKNPPGSRGKSTSSPDEALINFDNDRRRVQGAAIGGGTTMLIIATSSSRARTQSSIAIRQSRPGAEFGRASLSGASWNLRRPNYSDGTVFPTPAGAELGLVTEWSPTRIVA